LEKEGLFSEAHKRPLPYLPSRIGIVTSLSGAAIKDILRILDRRFSDIHIIINPVRVQGEEAKEEIAQAIKDFNRLNEKFPAAGRIEVMIVGRGGGSIEDLWAFNEEIVAKAVYNSKIPIVSAVGHERDWTITDLVADVRAATPSSAAELVIPKKEDLREKLDSLSQDLKGSALDTIFNYQENLDNLARQIYIHIQHYIKLKQAEFKVAIEKLSSLSPLNILGRGYSITFKMPEGKIIKDTKSIKLKDIIKTKLYKGQMVSEVTEVNKDG
jgi:exodeoxyribonuclease VII large subunit